MSDEGPVVITVDGSTWFSQGCRNREMQCEMVGTHMVRLTFTAEYAVDEAVRGWTGTFLDGVISVEPGEEPEAS